MAILEQLTLNTAQTLLTYLQYSSFEDEVVGSEALAALFCETLNQLESSFPGMAAKYGWTNTSLEPGKAHASLSVEGDLDR